MTAHEYLSKYKTCDRQIRFNFMQIENLKALTYSISSPSWGERVSGTRRFYIVLNIRAPSYLTPPFLVFLSAPFHLYL